MHYGLIKNGGQEQELLGWIGWWLCFMCSSGFECRSVEKTLHELKGVSRVFPQRALERNERNLPAGGWGGGGERAREHPQSKRKTVSKQVSN